MNVSVERLSITVAGDRKLLNRVDCHVVPGVAWPVIANSVSILVQVSDIYFKIF